MKAVSSFETKPLPQLLYGEGKLHELLSIIDRISSQFPPQRSPHVFVVTDSGLTHTGAPKKVEQLLNNQKITTTLYNKTQENPDESSCQKAASILKESGATLIVALGGGSSIDTAKAANLLAFGSLNDKEIFYQLSSHKYGEVKGQLLPLIAIPTTSGTGSECQSYALISKDCSHEKMAIGDPQLLPHTSILDPELTISQPSIVTACTGIDALAHTIESYVSRKRNELSAAYAKRAFTLLSENLESVFKEPVNLEARGAVLLGASLAGAAIENSMLGCAHASANPLTARYNITHGQAVAVMLPHVIRWNMTSPETRNQYSELHADLPNLVDKLIQSSGLTTHLTSLNIPEDQVDFLAQDAMKQWTGTFNPITPTEKLLKSLYQKAF